MSNKGSKGSVVSDALEDTPEDEIDLGLDRPRFSWGCTLIDLVVGGAKGVMGTPAGVIINLIGDRSAGKSFVKNEMIAASYHEHGPKRFKWFSDDTETGDTFDTTGLYGFNIRPDSRKLGTLSVEDTETVEELDAKVSLFENSVKGEQCGIYAVDSLDGLTDNVKLKMAETRANQLKTGAEVKDKGDYGMNIPKFLSQHFFKGHHKTLKKSNVTLVIVSQIRDNPDAGQFSQKWEVAGGKALEFYCHTRVFITMVSRIMKGDRQVGSVLELKTIKSKTPRPYRKCRFTVYFDYGIDDIGSSLDFLFDLRDPETGSLVSAKVSNIAWDGKEPKTLDNLRAWLKAVELDADCRAAKKESTGNGNLSVDFILDWVSQDANRQAKMDDHFGQTCSREVLIRKIEDDPKMQRELRKRVIAKWEEQEDAVASNRKRKYG